MNIDSVLNKLVVPLSEKQKKLLIEEAEASRGKLGAVEKRELIEELNKTLVRMSVEEQKRVVEKIKAEIDKYIAENDVPDNLEEVVEKVTLKVMIN